MKNINKREIVKMLLNQDIDQKSEEELIDMLVDSPISVDVDKHDALAREYGIMSVPTLLVYKDGKLVKQNTGFVQLDEIESWFN